MFAHPVLLMKSRTGFICFQKFLVDWDFNIFAAL